MFHDEPSAEQQLMKHSLDQRFSDVTIGLQGGYKRLLKESLVYTSPQASEVNVLLCAVLIDKRSR